MRTSFVAALFLIATVAVAQDAPPPLTIAIEPLGDVDHGVVARVFFRFANPRAITEAGLFLEGSFLQDGKVPRNFRYAVPRKDDKFVWESTRRRNGRILHRTRWTLLPDQRNELSAIHTFVEGSAEIEVRLVLQGDYGHGPVLVAKAAETFALAKTNRPYATAEDEIEEEAPAAAPEDLRDVRIRVSRPESAHGLFVVSADVRPPVTRVEFWIGDKKVLARNKPPYMAELDLGDSPQGVTLRVIGFDAAGRSVAADTFVVDETQ